MTIEIERGGRRRPVTLRRVGRSTREGSLGTGEQWIARLDGREVAVSVAEVPDRWSMLIGSDVLPPGGGSQSVAPVASGVVTAEPPAKAASRKSYDIAFEPAADGELIVHVNGVGVPLVVIDQPGRAKAAHRRGRRRGGEAGAEAAPRAIVAPMPGRIVRVLVQPGEAVHARQGLVVIEAMKMENEIVAPRSGVVQKLTVKPEQPVESGELLAIIE